MYAKFYDFFSFFRCVVQTFFSPSEYFVKLLSGLNHPYLLEVFISSLRGACCVFSFLFCFRQKFVLANSEALDQTSRNAASDLGLYCLLRSPKWGDMPGLPLTSKSRKFKTSSHPNLEVRLMELEQ